MKIKFRHIAIGLITLAFCHSALATKYYRWQDQLGSTQYTIEKPPAGYSWEIVEIRDGKGPSQEDGDETPQQVSDRPTGGDVEDDQVTNENINDVIQSRCDKHRENLRRLETEAIVVSQDPETGKNTVMSAEQREAALQHTKKAIEQCESTEPKTTN